MQVGRAVEAPLIEPQPRLLWSGCGLAAVSPRSGLIQQLKLWHELRLPKMTINPTYLAQTTRSCKFNSSSSSNEAGPGIDMTDGSLQQSTGPMRAEEF